MTTEFRIYKRELPSVPEEFKSFSSKADDKVTSLINIVTVAEDLNKINFSVVISITEVDGFAGLVDMKKSPIGHVSQSTVFFDRTVASADHNQVIHEPLVSVNVSILSTFDPSAPAGLAEFKKQVVDPVLQALDGIGMGIGGEDEDDGNEDDTEENESERGSGSDHNSDPNDIERDIRGRSCVAMTGAVGAALGLKDNSMKVLFVCDAGAVKTSRALALIHMLRTQEAGDTSSALFNDSSRFDHSLGNNNRSITINDMETLKERLWHSVQQLSRSLRWAEPSGTVTLPARPTTTITTSSTTTSGATTTTTAHCTTSIDMNNASISTDNETPGGSTSAGVHAIAETETETESYLLNERWLQTIHRIAMSISRHNLILRSSYKEDGSCSFSSNSNSNSNNSAVGPAQIATWCAAIVKENEKESKKGTEEEQASGIAAPFAKKAKQKNNAFCSDKQVKPLPPLLTINGQSRDNNRQTVEEGRCGVSKAQKEFSAAMKLDALHQRQEGLRVFEFFSGIGGMRLGLPEEIRGHHIENITAIDCSVTANAVYSHNFEKNKLLNHGKYTAAATVQLAAAGDEGRNAMKSEAKAEACNSTSIYNEKESVNLKYKNAIDGRAGTLKPLLIDGLRLEDLDGQADIWTLSPPCQPYSTTNGALRKDTQDNRAKPLIFLMNMLLKMKCLPRWIVLENVKGFVKSDMLHLWRSCITACGYTYNQYVLSPSEAVGIPNSRSRYYLIAEHGSSPWAGHLQRYHLDCKSKDGSRSCYSNSFQKISRGGEEEEEGEEENRRMKATPLLLASPAPVSSLVTSSSSSAAETLNALPVPPILTELPPNIAAQFPTSPVTIAEAIAPLSKVLPPPPPPPSPAAQQVEHGEKIKEEGKGNGNKGEEEEEEEEEEKDNITTDSLWLSLEVLSARWAAPSLSIVGPQDRMSYCFTKGYSKLFDKATGSCFYPLAEGPLNEKQYEVDRRNLPMYYKKIRRFHPNELLRLFGFPGTFSWPVGMSNEHKWRCIGNSVNVTVVSAIMACLFNSSDSSGSLA